jgi:hypothetical protein
MRHQRVAQRPPLGGVEAAGAADGGGDRLVDGEATPEGGGEHRVAGERLRPFLEGAVRGTVRGGPHLSRLTVRLLGGRPGLLVRQRQRAGIGYRVGPIGMRVVEGDRGGVHQRLGDHLVSGRDLVRSLTGRGETAACRGHEGSSWG